MNAKVEEQAAALREKLGEKCSVEVESSGGAQWVIVRGVELPPGWNQQSTTIVIRIPPGFPVAAPDCFWADGNLRLASGVMPRSTGVNADYGGTEPRLWFSFHVQKWNPNLDDLFRYFNVIRNRLEQAV